MKKLFITSICLALAFGGFSQTASKYKIVNKIHLDGDKGWDYIAVDEGTNHLFVSHGDMVQVVDLDHNNKVVGTIAGLNGVHGIAVADELNKGFISSGKDSSVVVFDLNSFATLTKIKVTGANPDAIVYDKFSGRVFTFNGRSKNSTVIDAKTNAVVGTIALPGKPEFAVADGAGKIYDNLEDTSMICVINTKDMKVETSWNLVPGDGPSGLAIDTKTHRLFSVCDNKMMIIVDANTGKVLTTKPIGDRVDAAAFDASLNIAYSSNGDGTLTVVKEDGDKFSVSENVSTMKGARTCCVNSKTHHIYLPTAEFEPAPAPTKEKSHPRPKIKPGTFMILDVAPVM